MPSNDPRPPKTPIGPTISQPGHDPDKLAGPERLFDKEKMRQYRDHQRNGGLQHRHHGTVYAADCDSGQDIGQPPVCGSQHDHVAEILPTRMPQRILVERKRSPPQCQPNKQRRHGDEPS